MQTKKNTTLKFFILLLIPVHLISSAGNRANAQSMGISSSAITADASSILEMRTTTKGMLIPRMSTTQRDAISSPATGLMIYNTTTNNFNFYNGSSWTSIFSGSSGVNSVSGTTNRITIGGTSSDPTVDISSGYAGQNSITTLGTIGTGTWNGSTIGLAYGGTGQTTQQAAINALTGAQTSGTYLRSNGTNAILSSIQAADVPTLNQNTTGSAATLTTARNIHGGSFNGSADVTNIIASTYGGTGNGFTKFTGPATAEKTFTLPDASATILTSNAAVTVAQGGTGTSTAFTPGSVVFAGASGVYNQNNSKIFWDNTNFRLGIGTASPNTALQVGAVSAGTETILIGGTASPGYMLNTQGTGDFGTLFSEGTNIVGIGFTPTLTVPSRSVFKVNKTGEATFGTSVSTDDNIKIQPFTGGANSFAGTITSADLTAARTYTLPDASGTLATLAGTETFTNKTISGASNTLTNIATSSLTGTLQATQFPALTGDVTTSAGSLATSITNNAVTNTKLAQIATQTFKGRTTAGTGNVEDLTATQATALLDNFTSTTKGLTPLSGGGTINYLRADGSWANPISSLGSSYWAFDGNSVGAIKNLGTTSNYDLPFITNNTEKMRITSTGNVGIGTSTFDGTNPEKLLVNAGATSSFNLINAKGNFDNYLQFNIQNTSAGNSASSDVVATADNGNESVNYIDMGINSSTFSNVSLPILGGINNAYLYSTGNDFIIGNATAAKNLRFFTGGTANTNERMRIDGNGKVAIGNTTASELLTLGTAGATAGTLSMAGATSGKAILTVAAAAGTPTITLPTATGTLATLAGTETFTNKTLTSPILTTPSLGVASSTSETITGTAGAGYLELQSQSSAPATGPSNSVRLFSNGGNLAWKKSDGFLRSFNSTSTADHTYTIPDANGTLAVSASGNIALSAAGNISFTGTLPIANGGTNSTATPTNGGIVYGNGTAYAISAAGTSGQVLQSAGAASPVWVDGGTMMFSGNTDGSTVNNQTRYFPLNGIMAGNGTDGSGQRNIVSRSGTIKSFYVRLSVALVAGKTGTVTVFKNGVATALGVTLSVGPVLFSDLADSFTVSAGDEVGVQITTTGQALFSWSAIFTN